MYLALLGLALLPLVVILSAVLVWMHGPTGLAAVLGASAVFLGLALYVKRVENRVRGLQAATPALEDEYRRVCNSWVHKALPDF